MQHHLSIDLETYSSVPIAKAGAQKYLQSPDFEILLFAYSLDGAPVEIIDLAQGEPLPQWLVAALTDPTYTKHAYNASFEIGYRLAMEELGLQPIFLLGMRLGEGSGCPLAFQVLSAACAIINDMATFDQAGIDDGYLEEIREGNKFSVEVDG